MSQLVWILFSVEATLHFVIKACLVVFLYKSLSRTPQLLIIHSLELSTQTEKCMLLISSDYLAKGMY